MRSSSWAAAGFWASAPFRRASASAMTTGQSEPKPVKTQPVKAPAKKPETAQKSEPKKAEPRQYAAGSQEKEVESFLRGLLERMGVECTIDISEREGGGLEVQARRPRYGRRDRPPRWNARRHPAPCELCRQPRQRQADARRRVDAEGYRSKREESLVHLAHKMAAKAIKYKRSMALEPMNSYERHVIHTALQDYEGVSTSSTGVEPNRRVVVNYERPAGETEEPRRGNRGERSRRPRENRENRAPRAAAPAPEKKAETAEPIPAPEYPAA